MELISKTYMELIYRKVIFGRQDSLHRYQYCWKTERTRRRTIWTITEVIRLLGEVEESENLHTCSLRTLTILYQSIRMGFARILVDMDEREMHNGKLYLQPNWESLKGDTEYSLLDILEGQVSDEYLFEGNDCILEFNGKK